MDGIDFERMKTANLLTPREAAKSLRISPRTLWAMTKPRGTIPAVRIGKLVRYSPMSLHVWVQDRLSPLGSVA